MGVMSLMLVLSVVLRCSLSPSQACYAHYPERVRRILVVNAPMFFAPIFKVLSAVLPAVMREQIIIVKNSKLFHPWQRAEDDERLAADSPEGRLMDGAAWLLVFFLVSSRGAGQVHRPQRAAQGVRRHVAHPVRPVQGREGDARVRRPPQQRTAVVVAHWWPTAEAAAAAARVHLSITQDVKAAEQAWHV